MKYQTIIFDLDGTLLDTLTDIKNAVNHAFNCFNINSNFNNQQIKSFIGSGAKVLFERAFKYYPCLNQEVKDKIFSEYLEYYSSHNKETTKPFSQVIPTLIYLKKNNVKLGVISNKPDNDAKIVVNYYFKDIFDFVIGSSVSRPTKPNPLVYLFIATEYKLNNKDVLYVGDSNVDLEFAKNCELDVALVTYGYGNIQENNGQTYTINNFSELIDIGEKDEETI